jgi:peroxiredoxin
MKSIPKMFLFAAATAAALAGSATAAVETGRTAPDFTLTDVAGKTQRLSDYKGKVVVLEWVNPGCPVVQRHYNSGNMQATQTAAQADGVVWLQINTGPKSDMSNDRTIAWLKKVKASSNAYLRDETGKVGRLYGAKATPHLFIVDQNGTLVYQGAIDDSPTAREADTMKAKNYVKAALASLKAGQPIAKANTQAYGCAVKYPKDS